MNSTRDKVAAASALKLQDANSKFIVKKNVKSEDETEIDDANLLRDEENKLEEKTTLKPKAVKRKKPNNITPKKSKTSDNSIYDPTKLEDNSSQVLERFKRGCECQDEQCFKGLNPETVYRHRLNIAELTKAEHDMYLMGVIRSCLTNPYETAKHTERQRLRAHYVYQGRKVCLDAFLYLENCTHYQVKRIRKHLSIHGVTPRVHGNYGKVPHNTFSLDIYQIATKFVKDFIKEQEIKQKTKATNNTPLYLPPDITRKTVHDLYKEYCNSSAENIKSMGYSTFRTFLKVQFPQLRFAKLEFVVRTPGVQNQTNITVEAGTHKFANAVLESTQIVNVPVIFSNESTSNAQTFIWTTPSKLKEGVDYQVTESNILYTKSGQPLTITNISTI